MKYILLLFLMFFSTSAFARIDCETLGGFERQLKEENKQIEVLSTFNGKEAQDITAGTGGPRNERIHEYILIRVYGSKDQFFIAGVFDSDGCNLFYGLFNTQSQEAIERELKRHK